MPFLRNIARGLRSLFRKEQVDRELDEELRGYLEMAAEEKMKDGMSCQEAQRAVRLEQGSLEVSKETLRASRWESLVETLWQVAFRCSHSTEIAWIHSVDPPLVALRYE